MSLFESLFPTIILLVVIAGFGIWVNRVGKPYPVVLFNFHKLIALGALILTGVRLFRFDPLATFPNVILILISLAGLSVIVLFATGAVMSIQPEVKPVFQWIHGISMVIVAGSIAAGLLLFPIN
jgi:hypothetical protein